MCLRILLGFILLLAAPELVFAGKPKNPEINIQKADYKAATETLRVKGQLKHFSGGEAVNLIASGPDWISNLGSDSDGNTKFDFEVSLGDQLPPCDVQVEAGSLSASKKVKHGSENCSPFELTIAGLVTDDPIPFATVRVTIGGVTYTTIADENGDYSLDIASILFDNLVLIEADFADDTAAELIHLASFAKYLNTANNGVVTQGTNVTNVTSAMFLAIVKANGGTKPTTVQELVVAETHVDATAVLETATVIKMILDGGIALPPECVGVSLLDCVASASLVADVIQNNPLVFQNTLAVILENGDLVAGFSSVPARYYAVSTSQPGFLPRGGELLEFGASDGELFTQLNLALPAAVEFDWSIDSGVLVLDFNNYPLVPGTFYFDGLADQFPDARMDDGGEISDEFRDCTKDTFGNTNYSNANFLEYQRRMTKITDGVSVDTVNVRSGQEWRDFDPVECSDGIFRTVNPILFFDTSNQLVQQETSVNGQPFTTTLAEASWALTFYFDIEIFGVVERRFGSDVATLNSDGSVVADNADSATWSWSLAGDDLLIDYGDGWTQRLSIINSLDPDGASGDVVEYLIFSVFDGPGGVRYATSDIGVQADLSLMFSELSLLNEPDHFWLGMVNANLPQFWDDEGLRVDRYFGWRFQNAGAGGRVTTLLADWLPCDVGDPRDPAWAFSPFSDGGMPSQGWSINAMGVLNMPYWDGYRIRTWKLLRDTTNDEGMRILYVFESETQLGLTRIAPRINMEWPFPEPTDIYCEVEY